MNQKGFTAAGISYPLPRETERKMKQLTTLEEKMSEQILPIDDSQPGSNGPSIAAGTKKSKSFLCKLTEDAVLNVIRFLSREPRGDNWISFVDPADVFTLLNCDEPLVSCARNVFRTLEHHVERPNNTKGAVVIGARRESRNTFYTLVSAARGGLEEISISRAMGKQHRRFLDNCPNLHTISISENGSHNGFFPLRYILSATSRSVKNLKLTLRHLCASDIGALRANCTGLKSLTLKIETVSDGLEKVWTTVGNSLEHLALSCSRYNCNPFGLLAISDQCPSITKLEFEDFPKDAQETLSGLCVRYGTKLQSLRLYACDISAEYLGLIAHGCKNVSLDFAEWMDKCVPSLVVLSPQVSTLELFDRDCDDWPGACNAIPSLQNLKRMTWNSHIGVHFGRFRHVLSKSLSKLSVLHISFRGTLDGDARELLTNVFSFLSGPSTCLEEFYFQCSILPTKQEIGRFLLSNPRLQKLHFEGFACVCDCHFYRRMRFGDHDSWKALFLEYCNVISTVLQAQMLNELRMSCHRSHERVHFRIPEITDLCYSARKRNICVSVCGQVYS